MNHFLQFQPVDAEWAQIQTQEPSPFTQFLLLDQNVLAGTPPASYSMVYADPTDRLNVASQSSPTQQIAYLSDIPPPTTPSYIEATDGNARAQCYDGGVTIIQNQTVGRPVFSSSTFGETTVVLSPGNQSYVSVNDAGDLDIKTDNAIKMIGINWSINGIYYPGTDGLANQVLMTNGANSVSWQTLPTPPTPTLIQAPDGNAQMVCSDGGENVIWNQTAGTAVFSSSTVGETTVIASPGGQSYVSVNDNGDLDIKTDDSIKMVALGWSINGIAYPGTDGLAGQVLETNGAANVQWKTVPGVYSQTSTIAVNNTTVETGVIDGSGLGSIDISSLTSGQVLTLGASGTLSNLNASQTIRIRLYRGITVIWDTGVFTMQSAPTTRPWTVSTTIVRVGANLVCEGSIMYRSSTNAFVGFDSETTTVFAAGSLSMSVQWSTANPNNQLTCKRVTLSRTY